MAEYPKMLYRTGDMLPDHARDYLVVADEAGEAEARADGWGDFDQHPLDHDGDGKPGGSLAGENATRRRGRKPRQ